MSEKRSPFQELQLASWVSGGIYPGTYNLDFWARVPEASLKTLVAVYFTAANGVDQADYTLGGFTLWLASAINAPNGGKRIVGNIIDGVTSAAPLAIPEDAGLQGFGVEFETISPWIYGRARLVSTGAFPWSGVQLMAGYQIAPAAGFCPCDADWRDICNRMSLTVGAYPGPARFVSP